MDIEDDLRHGLHVIAEHTNNETAASVGSSFVSTRLDVPDDHRGWMRRLGVALAGAAAVGTVVFVGSQFSAPKSPDVQDRGQTWAEWVSCGRLIFIGTVAETRSAGDRTIVTFHVNEWLKPTSGDAVVAVDLPPTPAGNQTPWSTDAEQQLVVVPQRSDLPADIFTGKEQADYAPRVREFLDEPSQPACPQPWRDDPDEP